MTKTNTKDKKMKLEEFKKRMSKLKSKWRIKTARFEYHNKNNTGGNFGYFINSEIDHIHLTIHADYDNDHKLRNIYFDGYKMRMVPYKSLGSDPINYVIETTFEKK